MMQSVLQRLCAVIAAVMLTIVTSACAPPSAPGGGGDGENSGAPGAPGRNPADDPPTADAGAEFSVEAGAWAQLEGQGVTRQAGSLLTFSWRQVDGPPVVLDDPASPTPGFIAPILDEEATLTFELVVSDGMRNSAPDRVAVVVHSAPAGASVVALWSGASSPVDAEVDWRLPSGAWAEVSRGGWGESGIETLRLPVELLEDGLHFVEFKFGGDGRYADLNFRLRAGDFTFTFDDRVQGSFRRVIALDVLGGVVRPVFNSWRAYDAPDAALTTGVHAVELLAGWREASNAVSGSVRMIYPDGTEAEKFGHGWANEGLERIIVPSDLDVADGDYTILFDLAGDGRYADVNAVASILDETVRVDGRLTGTKQWVVGADVTGGDATIVFNGWADAGSPDAAGVSGKHPLEVVGGWRGASNVMQLSVNVTTPDGAALEARRFPWALQGYERTFVPEGAPLDDGVYTLVARLSGDGRYADVDFHATLLNWCFDVQDRLVGTREYLIKVEVVDGTAFEISNTWRE